jgi:hypothetical protein
VIPTLAALALLVPIALAQDPPAPACAPCRDRGVVECRLCSSKPCRSDAGYLRCSVEAGCGDCGGARVRDCNQCERAPGVDPALRRGELAAWVAGFEDVEDSVGLRDLAWIETAHFVLVSDLKKLELKAGSTKHDAAHVVADWLERLHVELSRDLGVTDADFLAKTRVMLWTSEKVQEKASAKYTLERTTGIAKLMGKAPVLSLAYGKTVRGDDELRSALVHHATHCLASNLHDGKWTGSLKGGWIDEGLALLYENRLDGAPRNWCYLKQERIDELKIGRFEAAVRAMLAAGTAPPFTAIASLDTVSMSPEQRVLAWSYCDYVVRKHPGKLGAVLEQVQDQRPVSEAIPTALEMSLAAFELDWRAWVETEYSTSRR